MKLFNVAASLNDVGRTSHIFGPRLEILSLPWYTVLVKGTLNSVCLLRLQGLISLWLNKLLKILGAHPDFTLYISIASDQILLWWIGTDPSFPWSSSYDYFLSLYIGRRHLSWRLLIFVLFLRPWHIQTNEQ